MVQSSSRTARSNEAQTNHQCLPSLSKHGAVNEVHVCSFLFYSSLGANFLASFRLFYYTNRLHYEEDFVSSEHLGTALAGKVTHFIML